MAKSYRSGPSTLVFAGRDPIPPDTVFAYDFSETGPEGEHGPARAAALLACGAIVEAPVVVEAPRPGALGRGFTGQPAASADAQTKE